MNYEQVMMAMADMRKHFGKDILSNKMKFLSAFDDFAPKLQKERKLIELALNEKINYIFLEADKNRKDINKKKLPYKI